ncbi:tetratricopeptide repeat protein [Piscinibacter gummiphilus]|uniref:Tetratricopeptide repeat protein n=1 Tax=Piscinibacter gummiphilus TaxID=946333 RepID=A0ABZ0CY45_9BURK|nr:tetratricopeptide repeat protein [Piscinibacter gummiphilus]WOB07950.1 tetratricopeptide repeat protein [Piscinibacter gummiphilus]
MSPSGADDRQATLSLRKVQALLGLPAHVVNGLIEAGVVTPTRGPRHAWRFTFQDVVLLRTAHRLRTAQVPSRKLLRALARVKGGLGPLPLSGVRLTAIDRQVVVREGPLQWEAESGQLLMDFDRAAAPVVQPLPQETVDWFAEGVALEAHDAAAAEKAYRLALAADPVHAPAWLNLSALMCEQGRCDDAVQTLDEALLHLPDNADLHFNRGIALEDQQRHDEAIAAYERALTLRPELADAHYNLACLHERTGRPHRALRHLNEYRRLT